MRRTAAALIVTGAALSAAGCGEGEEARPAPLVASVTASAAAEGNATLTGEIRARYDSNLSFRVGGQIVARPVILGQPVRRGQVLAMIDAADVELAAQEAAAQAAAADRQVEAAQAAAARAAADERRLRPLVGAGGIAPQQYDVARAAADASAADLSAARARLDAARAAARVAGNQQRYATLVADDNGVVADVLAGPGQVVSPGQPVIRLARSGARDAVVAVPEMMRATLSRAAVAQVYGAGHYPAALRELSAAADPRTRTFEARYELKAGGAALPVGSTVSLRLDGGGNAVATAISLPLGAIVDRGSSFGVWVIGADSTVAFRPVRVDRVDGESAVISDGVRPGERVVALGAHRLAQGQKVRLGSLPR